MLADLRPKIQQICLRTRQFGVGIPGGAEGLIHFRTTFETYLQQGSEVRAIIDVDFKNAFPSLEWENIREVVSDRLPEVSDWTNWCHREPGRILLPSGAEVSVNRGVAQGDLFGPVYCALVLAAVAERTINSCQERGAPLQDAWFLDDGQLSCDPSDIDLVLRTLDTEAAHVGASRAVGPDAKSLARLLGPPDLVSNYPSWETEYILNSTTKERAREYHVLGIDFGTDDRSTTSQFNAAAIKISSLHTSISCLGDTACELVLLRKCADVCKVVHLLRAVGPDIQREALGKYDALLAATLQRCVGPLDEYSLKQASLGVGEGGLGMRRSIDLAIPAFVASRTESRWMIKISRINSRRDCPPMP